MIVRDPANGPDTRGGLRTSETPVIGNQLGEPALDLDGEAPPLRGARLEQREARPRRAASRGRSPRGGQPGPPFSTVSAAVAVDDEVGLDERLVDAERDVAWLTPRSAEVVRTLRRARARGRVNRRRNSGGTSRPISRGVVRRKRPPATRIVTRWTPKPIELVADARRSSRAAGSTCAVGIGSDGCSITTVAVPPVVTSSASGRPARGYASASRTAAPTSSTWSRGQGGRNTMSSGPGSATTTRESDRSGTRVTSSPGSRCVAHGERCAAAAETPSAMKMPPVT